MKKLIALLLALFLLASLAACGGSSDATNPAGSGKPGSNETKTPEPGANTPKTEPAAPAFQECTVIDNEFCTVKITEITESLLSGYVLKAMMENKTSDKTMCFTIDSASVNGVACEPFLSVEVPAGKKANKDISFSGDALKPLTEAYTDIEIALRAYDAESWEDITSETFHIYPYGEEKATRFVREAQPSDLVLLDNDQCTVVVTGYDPDSIWGYAVCFYLVNKTDMMLTFSADNVSVNGFVCDPYWAKNVAPGKVTFSNMDWSSAAFEQNGITAVEEIEFVLSVRNTDDFFADDLFSETFKLNP